MIKVYVYKQSNYPVSTVVIKKALVNFFKRKGIVSDAFVSVALVGKDKMLEIAKKYYGKNELHNVFSFVESEVVEFIHPKIIGINLGEIVVCYPQAVLEASQEDKLVEKKTIELVKHAGMHLLGFHHE